MAKIKYGVDPKLVERVAKEEMAKVLGREPNTHTRYSSGPFIGDFGPSIFVSNYGGLQIDEYSRTVEVSATANSGSTDHPNTVAAAKVVLNRLKEHGLVE